MRGFTLIELLAVIVILSIILLISVPIINGIIEETKKSAFESSAKGYMESAKNLYVTNSLAGISEDTVVTFTEGVPSNMKIEMSGGTPKSGTIVIYKTGSLEFALYDGVYCATKNISSNDITVSKKVEADCIIELPELTLIGDANIDLAIDSVFTEPGVTFETGLLETTIRKNGTIVSSIDTSNIGVYEITYKLTVSEKFNSITRTVTIKDTIAPELTIPGNISITVADVASFNALTGVSVTDNSGEVITAVVSGNVSALAGVYTLTYTATDSSNNITTKTRNITVLQPALVDTSSLTAAQLASYFSGNSNTSRGTTTFIDNGIIQVSSSAWDGAFVALNGTIPKTGKLTVEYQISLNVAYYSAVSTGAGLLLANGANYNPANVTTYYNAPAVAGIIFQTFTAPTSATFRWNVVAATNPQNIPGTETFPPTFTPTFSPNTFFSIKSYIDLDTGSFEHYCNGALVRSGKMSAASMATLGSTVKIVLINGNYTSQTATYKNIKVEVK